MFLLVLLLISVCNSIFGCPIYELNENFACEIEENSQNQKATINYRLPRHLKPIRYYITLDPNLEPNLNPATFTGSTTIEIKAIESSNNITLHINQLNISESTVSLYDFNGNAVRILNTSNDKERNFYIIHLQDSLIRDHSYNLTIGRYTGILNLENSGFYLAKYYDDEGNERRFATTQFQSLGARRAFPSFDEPHMKAKFRVSLVRKENQVSISNEELLSTEDLGNGKFRDVYKETVQMSTYLMAFVVTDYKHTEKTERQRVFGKDTAIIDGQGEYALHTGIEVLTALEEFLNVNYTLNKMDQIAIPDDHFAPGAMENWGLVTYRESYLVYPKVDATTREIERTLTIVAHEFAHQWFGNLVTCSWWKYIWLNEGFANYFQYYISSLVEPTWRLMDEFVLASVQSAFKNDALLITKPMNYEQAYPGAGPPTWVSYQKSGSVIRMFEHFVSHRVFRTALTNYLNENAFRAVQPPDLYRALQNVLDKENLGYLLGKHSLAEILETWDSQAGYPVVHVTRDYTTGHLSLTQRRFLLNDSEKQSDNSTWYIPINYKFQLINDGTDSSTTADFWMTKAKEDVNGDFPVNGWLIVNKQQTGYYRVNYDLTNWKRIIASLNNENTDNIHVLNRAQLIDDSFNLARAGALQYNIPLDLSKYIKSEKDYVPLSSFFSAMTFLKLHLSSTAEFKNFQSFINESLIEVYNQLGFYEKESDLHMDKINRINVLTWLCNSGNADCRRKSLNALKNWQFNDSNSIAPNIEAPVFCGAMRIGGYKEWDFLYEKYENAGNTSQRLRLLNGLGCSENNLILEKFLNKIANENSSIRAADRMSAFRAVYNSGNVGLNTAFDYIEKNFVKVNRTINMSTVLGEIGSLLTTQKQLNRLRSLSDEFDQPELFENGIEKSKENLRWNEKYIDNIKQWFRNEARMY